MANIVEIGLSPGYLKASRHFLNSINPKANPCEDFFEFACGRWVMENKIPDDLSSFGHFAGLREKGYMSQKKNPHRRRLITFVKSIKVVWMLIGWQN
ncbi:unnamed protein product [Toxocara canis]|uniref:Peptidase_M13_N domain-containing protein n=1 Tax=Toxocara canis TaxID=6265 RepID=A0A183U6N4_TOXCA|nr:unnamed protein product [Toxocara canis]